ncbi:hypothetical protein ACX0G9_05870 [Flavitalea flava]
MQLITEKMIDNINNAIQEMEEAQVESVWEAFSKEQPALVGYVLGESRELDEPDAREDVAYILTIILLGFREIQPGIPVITEGEFEKAFHKEFDEMEEVFHDGFDETDAMTIMDSFCQPFLLQFAAAIIYSEGGDGDEQASNFTEEEAGLFIVIFKTVIGLLDGKDGQSITGNN